MSARHSMIHTGFECNFPGPELNRPNDTSNDDANPIFLRVRKVLAYCCKRTRLARQKDSSNNLEDVHLNPMSSTDSTTSRRPAHRRRPTMLTVGREGSSSTQSSGSTCDHYSDCDPFITSPSWFKAEFLDEDTRS
ncbi:hypothetical protein DE146DRAFT_761206 [Phaeosphaeria sp. MPI-PUGE-AT-0046c]|nr:hypothetical protein DE146DRAFT_761206 [Phaeosphaeria sp. MPI-PUGE-AT-0046c]